WRTRPYRSVATRDDAAVARRAGVHLRAAVAGGGCAAAAVEAWCVGGTDPDRRVGLSLETPSYGWPCTFNVVFTSFTPPILRATSAARASCSGALITPLSVTTPFSELTSI